MGTRINQTNERTNKNYRNEIERNKRICLHIAHEHEHE